MDNAYKGLDADQANVLQSAYNVALGQGLPEAEAKDIASLTLAESEGLKGLDGDDLVPA